MLVRILCKNLHDNVQQKYGRTVIMINTVLLFSFFVQRKVVMNMANRVINLGVVK